MECITLQCSDYKLQIQAGIHSHSWTGGNAETGDVPRSNTWWQGYGRITTKTGDLVFKFETRKHGDISSSRIPSLQAEFFAISGLSKDAVILQHEKITEIFCKQIEKEICEQETSGKVIAEILLSSIDGSPLVNKGIILEPGHQMELALQ